MILAGFNAAYSDADLSTILTKRGVAALDRVDTGCVGDVIGAYSDSDPKDLVVAGGVDQEPWKTLEIENTPGAVRTEAPIYLVHSDSDELVVKGLIDPLYDRMCGNDQVVERVHLTDGQGHVQGAMDSYPLAFEWIDARFDGVPVGSTCS